MSKIINNEVHLDKKDLDFIQQKLDSRINIHQELNEYLMRKFDSSIVLTNSHTSALHLALCALNLKRADKVMCSVNAFPAAASAIRYFDAEPIFIDCNVDDYNINIASLKKALELYNHKKLRALFLSHHSGICAQIEQIKALCDEYEVMLINDASMALNLSTNEQKSITKYADISCFSLAPLRENANYSAGFLAINNADIYERAKLLGSNALIRSGWDDSSSLGYFYEVSDIGYDYSLNKLCAAAALNFAQRFDEFNAHNQSLAAFYNEQLAGLKHIQLPICSPNMYHYIIKVDKNRDLFARKLKEVGILCSIHFIPINFLSYYKQKYNLKITDFPNALKVYSQVLSIPFSPNVSLEDAKIVAEKIRELDASWV